MRAIASAGWLVVISWCIYAQTGDAQLRFEVASVKSSHAMLPDLARGVQPIRGGPGTDSPGQFTASGVPLKILLFNLAYNLPADQYEAPTWMGDATYDVVAKVPPGTTREQFRVMLQNLLIERFQIKIHHEQKELQVYDLVVAKSGLKIKPSTVDEKATPLSEADARAHLVYDPDGFPLIPAGPGPTTLGMMINRQQVIVTNQYPLSRLIVGLSHQLHRPISDKTGLTGNYAFTLHYSLEGLVTGPRAGNAATAGEAPEAAAGDIAPTIFEALQSQLGLKLEPRKAPIDVLVIDHAEKVPIEN